MINNNQIGDPFALFSIRQIVGGCLDWVQECLKLTSKSYIELGNPSTSDPKFDLKTVNGKDKLFRE
jgi:hypothetical protein